MGDAIPCIECRNEQRILCLEKDSERNQGTHKEFFNKFENLNIDSARSDEKWIKVLEAIAELKEQVAELAAKPSKRWESVIAALIAAAVGGLVGYFL